MTPDSPAEQLRQGRALDHEAIRAATRFLLDESANDDEKAAFLEALHARGESPEEIAGFVECFLKHAVELPVSESDTGRPLIDLCGTGGDKLGLFNISTASMFLVAAAGASVVKHGNRGITSKSGGADVLDALGVPTSLPPAKAREFLLRHHAVFLFAPNYHPAFKAVAPVRKMLAARGGASIFNLLGPLLNPARPSHQLVGVFHPELTRVFPEIFRILGRRRAWTVHGDAGGNRGMDEVSTVGNTTVGALEDDTTRQFTLTPDDFNLPNSSLDSLKGGDAMENARIIHDLLNNRLEGPKQDIVLANSAAALAVASLAESPAHGRELAEKQIVDKSALKLLQAMQG